MSSVARVIHMLLLSLWLGAGVFLMTVFAPDVFSLVPSRGLAGSVISRAVEHLDLFGLVAAPLLLISLIAGWAPLGVRLRYRAFGVLLLLVGNVASGQWLSPRMHAALEAMGRPIEQVDPGSALLVEFGNLHLMSTALLGVELALAFVLFLAAMASTTPKRRGGIEL